VCRVCGKPRERIVETAYTPTSRTPAPNKGHLGAFGERAANMTRDGFIPNRDPNRETVGWSDCGHNDYRQGVVLDPFLGSGTTALVARRNGRACVGIELSPEYAALAARRCQQLSLLAEGTA
jgi:hypothetical protein